MSKYWISVAAAVLWLAAVGNTAEIEGSTEFYYYGDERVQLKVVPDELSVGQSGEETLFNQATLQVEAGTVAVQTTQLGANTWRLRLDRPVADRHDRARTTRACGVAARGRRLIGLDLPRSPTPTQLRTQGLQADTDSRRWKRSSASRGWTETHVN